MPISDIVQNIRNFDWNADSLAWEARYFSQGFGADANITNWPATMPVSGTFWPTTQTITVTKLIAASGTASGSGNNTCVTPTSGKKLRLAYVSYNPSAAVIAAFRFGASGGLFLQNNVVANGIIAKDFGDLRYLEGAVNEALILNLDGAVSVIWNVLYQEI